MSPRIRKLVGTILLLVVLIIYSLVVMLVASVVLHEDRSKIVELIFYAVAGIAWIFPAGLLIRWMYAPRPNSQ